MKYKVCIICNKYQLDPKLHVQGLHKALESKFKLTRHFVDDLWPNKVSDIKDYSDFDIIIWFVRFQDLKGKNPFDWQDYKGLRLMYDWDACNNFTDVRGRDHDFGCWPKVYRDNNFQALIVTGKKTCHNLIQNKVNAYWIPKGYDDLTIHDKGQPRKGICYYGIRYPARKAMLHYLNKKGISFSRIRCTYDRLNENLNKFKICVVCNMEGDRRKGLVNKSLNFLFPSLCIDLIPAPEAMIKNFEIAGSGCVLFCDYIEELDDLKFVDAKTMVSYNNFDELVEKIRYYERHPQALEQISLQAAALAKKTHTWECRANMFEDLFGQLREQF